MSRKLTVALSCGMMHPDPERKLFKGKRLLYGEEQLFHWVMSGGALPYLLPSEAPPHCSLIDLLAPFDALLMTGGTDVAPHNYGEEPLRPEWAGDPTRDLYDVALVRAALSVDKPVLGICRGLQVLNVALGGSLYQDITHLTGTVIVHRDADIYDANEHDVEIVPGSGLARLYPGVTRARINSVHHQAIKIPAPALAVEAHCPDDGIIEAVRLKEAGRYAFAVQWHPEWTRLGDERFIKSDPILKEFLAAAAAAR